MTRLMAARTGDNHPCPLHGGGPIIANPHPVTCEGVTIATGGDRCTCVGPVDAIVTGSASVRVGGQPVARDVAVDARGRAGAPLAARVTVGGPAGGATVGNTRAAGATCQQAAATRAWGSTQQSAGNCGVESSRQVITRAGGDHSNGWALLTTSPAPPRVQRMQPRPRRSSRRKASTSRKSSVACLTVVMGKNARSTRGS